MRLIDPSKLFQVGKALPWTLKDCLLDLTKPVEKDAETNYFLTMEGPGSNRVGLLRRGTISSIQGKPKSGKSTAASLMCSALLSPNGEGPFKPSKPGVDSVLWIDTEQDRGTTQGRAVELLERAGLPKDTSRLQVASLGGCTVSERREFLLQLIDELRHPLVVLDGIADLVTNVNDEKECPELLDALQRVCSSQGTAFLCVIHENKGTSDSKGHLGSYLNQKAGQVFASEQRQKGPHELRCRLSRFSSIGLVCSFSYENGKPVYSLTGEAVARLTETEERERQEGQELKYLSVLLGRFMQPGMSYTPGELKGIISKNNGKGDRTAQALLGKAEQAGLVISEGQGRARRLRLPGTDEAKDEEELEDWMR